METFLIVAHLPAGTFQKNVFQKNPTLQKMKRVKVKKITAMKGVSKLRELLGNPFSIAPEPKTKYFTVGGMDSIAVMRPDTGKVQFWINTDNRWEFNAFKYHNYILGCGDEDTCFKIYKVKDVDPVTQEAKFEERETTFKRPKSTLKGLNFCPGMHVHQLGTSIYLIDNENNLKTFNMATYFPKIFEGPVSEQDYQELQTKVCNICYDQAANQICYVKPDGTVGWVPSATAAETRKATLSEKAAIYCVGSYGNTAVIGYFQEKANAELKDSLQGSCLVLLPRDGGQQHQLEDFSQDVPKYINVLPFGGVLMAFVLMAHDYLNIAGVSGDKLHLIKKEVKLFGKEGATIYSYQVERTSSHLDLVIAGYPCCLNKLKVTF